MAKPKRIGHLVINVKDVPASTKFYTEVLGFEVSMERPGLGTFLTCGKVHHDLALFQAPANAAPVTEGGLGLNHMAIQVEDFQELTDYYHRLQDHFEASDLRTVDHVMTKSIYIKDPDGNGIELFCNTFENAADGLAEMRRPGRQNSELVFDRPSR
jgi:catechol-2,3-dioxygenase